MLLRFCSSFRDSTYGEGGDGGGLSQEDNYPAGLQHQGDQNGIESTIDQIFEGISHFLSFPTNCLRRDIWIDFEAHLLLFPSNKEQKSSKILIFLLHHA